MIILKEGQKLSLLVGNDVLLENGMSIKSITIRDMLNYGYDELRFDFSLFLQTIEELIKPYENDEIYLEFYTNRHKLNKLMFHKSLWLYDAKYKEIFNRILSLILGVSQDSIDVFSPFIDDINDENAHNFIIYEENSTNIKWIIDEELFDTIVYIYSLIIGMNTLNGSEEQTLAEDDKAQAIIDKINKANEKIDRRKRNKKDEKSPTLFSMISGVTTKSNHINKMNLKEHTMFQVYEEFMRLKKVDEYNLTVKATLAGAQDIEIQNWEI